MSINLKQTRVQSDGVPQVATSPRRGREAIYATHNFCDATTWYSESTRVVEKSLTKNGGVWGSGDPCWIDMTHGKVFDEEAPISDQATFDPGDPHGYAVIVEASEDAGTTWDVRPQRDPFAVSGGDYTVDYALGEVTFVANAPGPGDLVRASYSKKGTSAWVLKPLPDKSIAVEKSEIQFSADVDLQDTFVMEVYGLVDYFAPELLDTADPPGPLPSGTPIPLETTKYKTIYQFIDESVGFFPALPAIGGATRGTTQATHILQFHYGAAKVVYSSLGMYIRISLEADTMLTGERVTATFYLTSHVDTDPMVAIGELTG